MNRWPKLTNPPIIEGLIDLRVERSADASLAALRDACDELAAEFPSRQERRMFVTQLSLSPEVGATSQTVNNEPDGIILRSVDDKWVAQFRLDGFTLSRLKPYSGWSELREKASALWTRYAAAAKPVKVIRIASRFLNRIPLPPGESFEKTLLTNFVVAPALPQAVAGYLLRVVIPFDEHDATAIITQSLETNSTDCLFDLDTLSLRPEGIGETEMWRALDDLREVKNRLFFGSLSPSALERFK